MSSYRETINQRLASLALPKNPMGLYAPMRYTLNGGGKRLRPILMMMTGELFDGDKETLETAALAVEVFHNATLVHDDVMDAAALRRGRHTIHQKWDPSIAILTGDALTGVAYTLLNQTPPETLHAILAVFGASARRIYEGQALDLDFETRKGEEVSLESYLKMVGLKTASLFAGAMKISALLSKASTVDQEHVYQLGEALGIAFQIQDDCLDAFGETAEFGKTTGSDIVANKKTFLLLKAYALADPRTRAELDRLLALSSSEVGKKIHGIKGIFTRLDIKAVAENERDRWIEEALTQLDAVAALPERKVSLKEVILRLRHRNA